MSNTIPRTTNKYPTPGGRHIYNALYDTLVQLKPSRCLEIGTYYGQSAAVFQDYFDAHCPSGLLITIDIKKYVDLSGMKNVHQVIGHPHVTNSTKWHFVTEEELLDYDESSVRKNVRIIQEVTHGHRFDFCFLDGDHQFESARRDLLIAQNLLCPPKYILFDDIDVPAHESCHFFHTVIEEDPNWKVYKFEDWGVWVGAAMIWEEFK